MKNFFKWIEDLVSVFTKKETPKQEYPVVDKPVDCVEKEDPFYNKKILYCPFAIKNFKGMEMKVSGFYRKKYPEGAVIHYTAGQYGWENNLSGIDDGYLYFMIDKDGTIYQHFSLDMWGDHAGRSFVDGFDGNVSKYFVGIEVFCAGNVVKSGNKYAQWFERNPNKHLPKEEVRVVSKRLDNMHQGAYHAYTKEQEESLTKLILWLKVNNPDVFNIDNVFGHDEVCYPKGRKTDPGGALSMSMPKYREYLKEKLALTKNKTKGVI